MPFKTINVAIVSKQILFRTTLKTFLSEQQNLAVIVQAADMTEHSGIFWIP